MVEPANVRIWARTLRGLEWIAAAEAECITGISNIKIGHRELTFNCTDLKIAQQLRTIDDAYILWCECRGMNRNRASLEVLEDLLKQLSKAPIKFPFNLPNLRVTASFLGKRNYNRYEIEEVVGNYLAKRFGLNFIESNNIISEEALWCRIHLEGESVKIGFRLAKQPLHRRSWRQKNIRGALHPPLAAAMVLLANSSPGQIVLDPFVGNGTILIEAGIRFKNLNLIGCDISDSAIKQTQEHARLANVEIKLITANASMVKLPLADCIITNPPWGKATQLGGNLNYDNLLPTLFKHLKPHGRLVMLIDQEMLAKIRIKPLFVQTVRVAGRLADIIILGPPPCFANNKMGRVLEKFWRLYQTA
jgi:23S rRNA G2445 N2-methylase RlmL